MLIDSFEVIPRAEVDLSAPDGLKHRDWSERSAVAGEGLWRRELDSIPTVGKISGQPFVYSGLGYRQHGGDQLRSNSCVFEFHGNHCLCCGLDL